jgi:predicted dinucleotide-binding enzyme
MRIGILGSGLMGGKLGTIFARAGHEVVFSYARSEQKLKKLARDAKGKARPGTPREAAQEAGAVLLAVHWSRMDDVLGQAGDLSGKVVVSCSLPMNDDDTGLVVAHTSSGAEELAKKIPHARVVSAFNTVPSEVLFDVYAPKRKASRPSLVYCGDDESSKKIAAGLIRDVGFDPVDAGPLRIARYTEPFALLVAQLAYEGFYVIVGGAAGALIGLQFVVMTLIAARPPQRLAEAGPAFATPTIVHFGTALLLSAVLRAPWQAIALVAGLWGLVGLGGMAYAAIVVRRMRRQTAYQPDFEDWLLHVLLPLAAYAVLALSAFAASSHAHEALFCVGAAVLLLLFIGIHNSWDGIAYHVFVTMRKAKD